VRRVGEANIAEQLVRKRRWHARIADRDIVELTNLQRQVLFTEDDGEARHPKALAAAERLARINSDVDSRPARCGCDANNIEDLLRVAADRQVDLILDGTDNVENPLPHQRRRREVNVPWIYGGCVGV